MLTRKSAPTCRCNATNGNSGRYIGLQDVCWAIRHYQILLRFVIHRYRRTNYYAAISESKLHVYTAQRPASLGGRMSSHVYPTEPDQKHPRTRDLRKFAKTCSGQIQKRLQQVMTTWQRSLQGHGPRSDIGSPSLYDPRSVGSCRDLKQCNTQNARVGGHSTSINQHLTCRVSADVSANVMILTSDQSRLCAKRPILELQGRPSDCGEIWKGRHPDD